MGSQPSSRQRQSPGGERGASPPTFDPVFDSQRTFRALLDCMARPGRAGRLPALDPTCPMPGLRAAASVLLTLLDQTVTFALVDNDGSIGTTEDLAGYLTAATGSRPAPLQDADFVVAPGRPPASLWPLLRRGSPTYPDQGATLIVAIAESEGTGTGIDVALSGPGVPPTGLAVRLAGLTEADLAARAAANAEPPRGVDLILVGPGDRIVCLPRSTTVAVSPAGRTVTA